MIIENTEFEEVKILFPEKLNDKRGSWKTVYSKNDFFDCGIDFAVLEERVYYPIKGSFYGIHFQNNPHRQNKLISLINGKGLDFIVDLRRNSSTYKRYLKIELDSERNEMIYVPHGFGHAFLAQSENVIMSFKIDEYFNPKYSRAISYKDPEINLDLSINEDYLSEQDKNAPFLRDSDCNL